jgi:ribose 1,5-bisphosphokinase
MTGRLIYVMGPSGAGKDSVLRAARAQAPDRLWFAHRYITRPAGDASENHVALSPAEFAARQLAGGFVLDWDSHGWRYGLGVEIADWLAGGASVVVNGSRGALQNALARFPDLLPVMITASEQTRSARLALRGRESACAMDARLRHLEDFSADHPDLVTIVNDATLAEAVASFLAAVR